MLCLGLGVDHILAGINHLLFIFRCLKLATLARRINLSLPPALAQSPAYGIGGSSPRSGRLNDWRSSRMRTRWLLK
jgi:hypothetical protein